MPEIINNIINLISKLFSSPWGSVVGVLVGGLIGHYLAIGRDKRKEFAQAKIEFMNAFKDFIVMLETDFRYENGRFGVPIPDHLAAAKLFRQHLGRFRRKRFDRKLAQYKLAAEEYDEKAEKCFGVKNIPHDINLKLRKRIYALLKYANPKK